MPPQLQKSRELNSEGLEGFVPRASELLKLAASLTLSFGPWILAVVAVFSFIYGSFGDSFVHGGDPSLKPPPMYDPDTLLAEDTYYPMASVRTWGHFRAHVSLTGDLTVRRSP